MAARFSVKQSFTDENTEKEERKRVGYDFLPWAKSRRGGLYTNTLLESPVEKERRKKKAKANAVPR